MAITKEQAIDILEKFDFFQGQRAGRELWNDKPFEVQEQDIKDFSNDVALLKEYISDVVPKSEVDELKAIIADHKASEERLEELYSNTKAEVAREIFEEIARTLDNYHYSSLLVGEIYPISYYDAELEDAIAELKKKYTEVNDDKTDNHT